MATGNVWLEEKVPQRWGQAVLSQPPAPPWDLHSAFPQLASWRRSASACMEKKCAKILIYLRNIHQVNYKRKWICPTPSLLDRDWAFSFHLFLSSHLLSSFLFSLSCNPSSRLSTWQHQHRIQGLVIFLVFFPCFAWENSQNMATVFYLLVLIEFCCGSGSLWRCFGLWISKQNLEVYCWTCGVHCTKLKFSYPPLL